MTCGVLHCLRLSRAWQGLLRHQARDFCVPSNATSQSHEFHAEIFKRALKTEGVLGNKLQVLLYISLSYASKGHLEIHSEPCRFSVCGHCGNLVRVELGELNKYIFTYIYIYTHIPALQPPQI